MKHATRGPAWAIQFFAPTLEVLERSFRLLDSSRANAASKVITKAYSGFVHAASPHIMDMCGGAAPRFDVNGEFRSLRGGEHAEDALNYFLRALFSMAFAAKAFGDEALFSEMHAKAAKLEARMQANVGRISEA